MELASKISISVPRYYFHKRTGVDYAGPFMVKQIYNPHEDDELFMSLFLHVQPQEQCTQISYQARDLLHF